MMENDMTGTKQSQSVPHLRFPEFEGEWVEKKLGKVLNITSASRVHKDEWTKEGVPFFRSSDVVAAFKGDKNKKAYIPLGLYESLSNKIGRVKKNDLLITGGGSIGIPFLVKNNKALYFKDADLLWIQTTTNINGYFLYTLFLSQRFKKYLKSISHIGTIAHYTVNQAKNTPFKFPTPPEQTRIANFLTAVDKRINLLQKKKAELEQYKKGVMQKLFSVAETHGRASHQSETIRFKNDDGSDFPDWEEKRLGEVFENKGGTSLENFQDSTGTHKFISIGNYSKVGKYIDNGQRINVNKKSKEKILEKDNLVMVLNDKTKSGDIIGSSILIDEHDRYIYNQRSERLICKENIQPIFAWHFLNSNLVRRKIFSVSQGGTQIYVNFPSVRQLVFDIPSIKEQQKIANFLSSIDKNINNLQLTINNSQLFKKGLLQKMFV